MSYRLDPHEFRAWLYCQPLRKVLAFPRDRERCPLAVHLSAEMGEPALHPLPLTPALALRILDKIAADG
jgi:hypothetical protein